MAAPLAYGQPTINRAWEAFVAHVPTILLIWIATVALSAVGWALYWLIQLVAIGVTGAAGGSGRDTAILAASSLAQLVPLAFAVLANLVGVLFVAVPVLHYDSGDTITPERAFGALLQRPWRYLLAGILFSLVASIGFVLCILPGILVFLVMPVYVNRIFLTDQPITDAFAASFQAVFRSAHGPDFLGIQVLAWLLVLVISVCTCGLGALLAVPVSTFYVQNAAYHRGVIS